MTKARDLSKLLSTSNGKIAGSNLDVSFENISDTGTEGTKIASGTTAQRGSTQGQWRFNTTTGLFEGRDASSFVTIAPSPTISSVSPTNVESAAGGNETFTITGTNFSTAGATVKFIANDASEITASSVTVNSATSITAVIAKSSFANAKEPYDIQVTNTNSNNVGLLADQINVDNSPAFTTAAGSLGTVEEDATGTHFTIAASDPDGDAVTFAETGGSNVSGSGLTLNSDGTISGDPTDVSSDTTISFTARATANGKTADRAFSYVVGNNVVGAIQSNSLRMWFDANATNTQTLSGSTVTQWNSRVNGSNVQFRKFSSGVSPTQDTSTISGKTLINIPGTGSGMWGYDNVGTTFNSYTWVLVMSHPTTSQFTQFMGTGNNVAGQYMGFGESGQGNGSEVDLIYGFGRDRRFSLSGNSPINVASTTTGLRMLVARSNSTLDGTTIRVNGNNTNASSTGSNLTVAFKFSHGASEPSGANDDQAGWWGQRVGESNLSTSVKAAEWILWDTELSDTDVQTVESYLTSKWGSFS
tara:strand:- start:1264 stop:2853 length:1590 start_codon:yes stop_codon:yes gene_type:complete